MVKVRGSAVYEIMKLSPGKAKHWPPIVIIGVVGILDLMGYKARDLEPVDKVNSTRPVVVLSEMDGPRPYETAFLLLLSTWPRESVPEALFSVELHSPSISATLTGKLKGDGGR